MEEIKHNEETRKLNYDSNLWLWEQRKWKSNLKVSTWINPNKCKTNMRNLCVVSLFNAEKPETSILMYLYFPTTRGQINSMPFMHHAAQQHDASWHSALVCTRRKRRMCILGIHVSILVLMCLLYMYIPVCRFHHPLHPAGCWWTVWGQRRWDPESSIGSSGNHLSSTCHILGNRETKETGHNNKQEDAPTDLFWTSNSFWFQKRGRFIFWLGQKWGKGI